MRGTIFCSGLLFLVEIRLKTPPKLNGQKIGHTFAGPSKSPRALCPSPSTMISVLSSREESATVKTNCSRTCRHTITVK